MVACRTGPGWTSRSRQTLQASRHRAHQQMRSRQTTAAGPLLGHPSCTAGRISASLAAGVPFGTKRCHKCHVKSCASRAVAGAPIVHCGPHSVSLVRSLKLDGAARLVQQDAMQAVSDRALLLGCCRYHALCDTSVLACLLADECICLQASRSFNASWQLQALQASRFV